MEDLTGNFFSTLPPDQQLRLFPAYLLVLQQQLSKAHIQHNRLLEALNVFDPINKYYKLPRYENLHSKRTCRNCFMVVEDGHIFQCQGCLQFGCIVCNGPERRVRKCETCLVSLCERCDAAVLFEECSVCFEIESINTEIENRAKLLENGGTRAQSSIKWMINQQRPLRTPVYSSYERILNREVYERKHPGWQIVFCDNYGDSSKDFPDESDHSFIVMPKYQTCPKSTRLVYVISVLMFDGDLEQSERCSSRLFNVLDNYKGVYSFRTTVKAGEVIAMMMDAEIEGFTKENIDKVLEKIPDVWDKIFE